MAKLIETAIRRLLPRGQAWKGRGTVGDVLDALALSIQRAKDFLADARFESMPGTAEDTLREWFFTYGIAWDKQQNTASRQKSALAAHTNAGGQSFDYITQQIQLEFPNVIITETPRVPSGWDNEFTVSGDVLNSAAYYRLQGLIERIAPAHLEVVYDIRILSNLSVGRTGLAITGRAITGRIE